MTLKKGTSKRTYACNADLLKYHRTLRGWTQAELAAAAGYSERLVSKAESGNPISSRAIEDLAETLSSGQNVVYPEDLIYAPVRLAKAYISALYTLGKDAFSVINEFLDENFHARINGDPAVIPFAGEYHGPDEFERFLAVFFSVLESPPDHDFRPWYTFVPNGNEVVAVGRTWLHPIDKPMEQPMAIAIHFKFRRGKLLFLEDHYDTLEASRILASSTQRASVRDC